jgi:hypothetical protein
MPDAADMEGKFATALLMLLLCLPTNSQFKMYHILGISKLCTLLSIDPYEDIRVLVLLWKLGATKKPAEIQRDEFVTGSCNMNFDSVDKLKELVPSLDTGFLDMDEFKDFYKVREILWMVFDRGCKVLCRLH